MSREGPIERAGAGAQKEVSASVDLKSWETVMEQWSSDSEGHRGLGGRAGGWEVEDGNTVDRSTAEAARSLSPSSSSALLARAGPSAGFVAPSTCQLP